MRELPIIFNTEMIRAILIGDKVCTRRPIKTDISNQFDLERDGSLQMTEIENSHGEIVPIVDLAPYQTGDLLYVRETWQRLHDEFGYINIYRADDPEIDGIKWIPSIHMPKKYARIWLKVTNVRVERVQDITEEEAKKEGVNRYDDSCYESNGWSPSFNDPDSGGVPILRHGFERLWDSLYKNWDSNPWVWVIDFEVVKK